MRRRTCVLPTWLHFLGLPSAHIPLLIVTYHVEAYEGSVPSSLVNWTVLS